MKSIFLRIYGGMLLALLLVSGLGLLGLHWINEVRGEHYREELARGTFRLMADNLQPMTRHRAQARPGAVEPLAGDSPCNCAGWMSCGWTDAAARA